MDKRSIISAIKTKCTVKNVKDVHYKKLQGGPLILHGHAFDKKINGVLRGQKSKVQSSVSDEDISNDGEDLTSIDQSTSPIEVCSSLLSVELDVDEFRSTV
jgi:uncharacterized protein YajQ (UPF0234 family)